MGNLPLGCLSGGQVPSDDNLHPILTNGHLLQLWGSSLPPPFYSPFPSSVNAATASPKLPPTFCTRQATPGLLPRPLALILEAWLKAASFVLCPGRGEGPTDLVQCCSVPTLPGGHSHQCTGTGAAREPHSGTSWQRAAGSWIGWGSGRSGLTSSPWSH